MKELELTLPLCDLEVTADDQRIAQPTEPATATEPDELVLTAARRIVLRCGRSSLTLHANGKIVLRGEYILSEAEDVNRVAGGRIELN